MSDSKEAPADAQASKRPQDSAGGAAAEPAQPAKRLKTEVTDKDKLADAAAEPAAEGAPPAEGAPAAPEPEAAGEPAPAPEAPDEAAAAEALAEAAPVDPNMQYDPNAYLAYDPNAGAPAVAPMAQYTAQALAGRTVDFKLLLPNAKCGVVIGKGGAMIKHVREASGCAVDVSENAPPGAAPPGAPAAPERIVSFSGDFGAVYAAFQMVLAHLAASVPPGATDAAGQPLPPPPPGAVEAVVLVPRNKTGGLIGRGGASINRVRQDSGATVKVGAPEDVVAGDPDVRKCVVSGALEQVMAAFTLIVHKLEETPAGAARAPDAAGGYGYGAAVMAGHAPMAHGGMMPSQLAPGTMPVQFQVPNESMGAVIGRAGATVNQIRQMSGAKVDIAQSVPGMPMRLVTVTGTPDQIQMAQYLIQVKMGGGSLPTAGSLAAQAAGAQQVAYDPQQLAAAQQQAALAAQQQAQQYAGQPQYGGAEYAQMVQQQQMQMAQMQQAQMQAQQQAQGGAPPGAQGAQQYGAYPGY